MCFETVPGLITINATLPLQILHFIIFMFIMDRIMFRPMLRIMDERNLFIEQKIKELEKIKKEAKELELKFKEMEREARIKASRERTILREEGLKEAEKILEESRKKVVEVKREIEKKIEDEIEKARPLLFEQAKIVAQEIINKIVGSGIAIGIICFFVIFFLSNSGFAAIEQPSKARLIWQEIMLFVNFGIIVFLFLRYGKKSLLDYIFKERNKIKERIEGLEKEYNEAKLILDQQTQKLANIESYIQDIRKSILELAEREKQKIIENAKREAENMLEEAKLYHEFEAEKAKKRLREELAIMAINFVKESLRKRLTKEMDESVIKEFIRNIEKTARN